MLLVPRGEVIGRMIRAGRGLADLKQSDLTDLIGSNCYLSDIELGKREVDSKTFRKIVDAFQAQGVTVIHDLSNKLIVVAATYEEVTPITLDDLDKL